MILDVQDISVYYGSIAGITDVSIQVNQGDIVAIVGANGAGKSTTMNFIAGLLPPKTGEIFFDGEDIATFPPEKRAQMGISLVPEDRGILTDLTVGENLKLALSTKRNQESDDPFAFALKQFPILSEFWSRPAGSLSGGQQQMLAIGRALVANPKLLLLDEPSLGLAPVVVDELFEIIVELKSTGVTIILVEQFAQRAIAISDYTYLMKNHKIVAQGKAESFANKQALDDAYLGKEGAV